MFKRSAPLMLFALVACEPPDPTDTGETGLVEAPDLETLVMEGGCGDVLMYVGSEDRSLILVALAENLSEQSFHAGSAPMSATYDLSEAPERLRLVQGHDVFDLYCNDVTDDEVVETTWTAVSGQITVTATSTGEASDWGAHYGDAIIEVEDVVLEAPGAEDVTIDFMSWEAYVGWMAG